MSDKQKYKISLVQTNDEIGGNIILPLAAGILWQAAMMDPVNSDKWQLENIVYNKNIDVKSVAKQLSSSNVVSMSTYIWNVEFHLELAHHIKRFNPDCFIVLGGPEINPNSDIWDEHADIVDLAIVGEGDTSFTDLLRQWPMHDVTTIPGAWTKNYYNGEAPRVTKLEPLPSPYLSGFYNKIVQDEISKGKYIQAVLQTNRGCPYHCTFCEEGKDYKNKMFFYDEQRIRDEIEWCGKNQVEYLTLADDNWGISARDVDLMRFICETRLKHGYPKTLDATWAKNAPERLLEMAQIDKELGTNLIRGITIALQSINSVTLKSIKRFNLIENRQANFIKSLIELQVPTYVEIIWPLPYETLETFCQGVDQIINANTASWLAVYPLKLQKSTDLYDDHHADYMYPNPDPAQLVIDDFHPSLNTIPYASKWASHENTVDGHLIFTWVAIMHYFGYAYPAVDWLRRNRGYSVTEVVLKFRNFLKTKVSATQLTDQLYQEYWSTWLHKRTGPDFSIFPEEQTRFWYPYTHMSSRIQRDSDDFYQCLGEFLTNESVDPVTVESLVYLSRNGVVHYNKNYPCQLRDGTVININHEQPEFPNPAEFSQFYYWFKRKQGYSKISLANSPEYQALFA